MKTHLAKIIIIYQKAKMEKRARQQQNNPLHDQVDFEIPPSLLGTLSSTWPSQADHRFQHDCIKLHHDHLNIFHGRFTLLSIQTWLRPATSCVSCALLIHVLSQPPGFHLYLGFLLSKARNTQMPAERIPLTLTRSSTWSVMYRNHHVQPRAEQHSFEAAIIPSVHVPRWDKMGRNASLL
jgi:hypothetical protein